MAEAAEPVGAVVFAVALEEGGGGVEEQQVDLEVEQVGGGEEHRLLHPGLGVGGHQQVHRPVRLVVVHASKPGDGRVLAGPLGRRQLAHRIHRAIGDQGEQHPLHRRGKAAAAQHPAQGLGDAQPLPQPVQQPHRPELAGGLHLQRRLRAGRRQRAGAVQVAADR
jgi:hypothetical protein